MLPFCFSSHQMQLLLKSTKGLKHYRSSQVDMYPKGSISYPRVTPAQLINRKSSQKISFSPHRLTWNCLKRPPINRVEDILVRKSVPKKTQETELERVA